MTTDIFSGMAEFAAHLRNHPDGTERLLHLAGLRSHPQYADGSPSIIRRNQISGAEIEVCTADAQDLDPEGGKWVSICWTHGTVMNHETRRRAESAMAIAWDWCEDGGRWDEETEQFVLESSVNSCRHAWEAKQTP